MTGYTLPLFVLPTIREATHIGQSFWRVTIDSLPDSFGNSVSFYVEAGDPVETGDPGVALTELAWQEVFRRLRDRIKTR